MRHSVAAALSLVIVALAFGLAHIDDGDGLLYLAVGRRMWATGEWLAPIWPPGSTNRFVDHLPVTAWPLAVLDGWGGRRFVHVGYALLSVATWLLLARTCRPLAGRATASALLVIVACTESFLSVTTTARLEPVFLFACVASLACAAGAQRRPWLAGAAGALAGVAMLWRGPFALILVVMLPIVLRTWRSALLALGAGTTVVLTYASLDAGGLQAYWAEQISASWSGARADGDPRPYAALVSIGGRFWPGLAFIPFAFVAPRKKRLLKLACLWVAVALAGLALGQRHVPAHALVAYPGLFVLAALGARRLWVFAARKRVVRFVPVAALGFGVVTVMTRADSGCDVVRFARLGEARHCAVVQLPGEELDWILATRVVEHGLASDVRFVRPAEALAEPGCVAVAVAANETALDAARWRTIERGARWTFYESVR